MTVEGCECFVSASTDPNLLREYTQRKIETADFIRSGGVDGGFASLFSLFSALSSTSNTHPRPDDNNLIPNGFTAPIVLFLIALPLFQKVLNKNTTGYLDTDPWDLRGKDGVQGKAEIRVYLGVRTCDIFSLFC